MKKKKFPKASIEIKHSKLDPGGVGIFAIYGFKKGEIIGDAVYNDAVFLTWDEVKKLDKVVQSMIQKFCIGGRDGVWSTLNFDRLPALCIINHSCDFNVGFDEENLFIAAKNIKAGDELCIDYGLAYSNPDFRMECSCGASNCRKIITGDDWHNLILDKRYKKYMFSLLKDA